MAFLDEPTAGVDLQGRQLIRDLVAELRSDGVCVVLTTHDLEEADALADRIVIVDGARTPVGSFGGALKDVPAHELGATAVREALQRAGVAGEDIDEVVMGCIGQVGPDARLSRNWPRPDGILEWDVFADPNGGSGRPEVITYDAAGELRYVYWNAAGNDYVLLVDETDIPEGLTKLYYREWSSDLPLSLGNHGPVPGAAADVQHALLSEFKMERPGWYGLDPNHLTRASIELTIDRVIEMSLSGNNMALLPSVLYVNGFAGDGVVGRFENAQADFERIDHATPDAAVWLTMDGAADGTPITDFALSWHRLVDPGLGEPLTLTIDVTESVRRLLAEGVDFAGFILSCSPDGEFCLASIDLVDDVRGKAYLPALVLETDLQ